MDNTERYISLIEEEIAASVPALTGELSEVPEAARLFADAGIQLLNVSGGMCGYDRPGHTEPGWFAELAEAAKKASGLPVALAGGIKDGPAAEALLKAGKADLIGMGRAMLKDPGLAGRILAGQ